MTRILILLTSMLLLVGCVESMALIGGGATSGKTVQASLNSAVNYGIKKTTGKTPIGHALNYVKKDKTPKKNKSCSAFDNEKDLKICLMVEKKISNHSKLKKKKFTNKPSMTLTSSLQSSIDEKSKIKYLD